MSNDPAEIVTTGQKAEAFEWLRWISVESMDARTKFYAGVLLHEIVRLNDRLKERTVKSEHL